MKAYYYRHTKGYLLAPVYAKTEQESKELLLIQHIWCNATTFNTRLEKVENKTIYEQILES